MWEYTDRHRNEKLKGRINKKYEGKPGRGTKREEKKLID
jgi:hypothetical protein